MHKIHNHTMPVEVHRSGYRKPSVIKRLHVCKLLGGRYAGQVEPGSAVAVRVVVSFVFYVAETCAA